MKGYVALYHVEDVGIAFLHVKPDDESQLEALPFKLRKPRETDIGREESRIDSLTD